MKGRELFSLPRIDSSEVISMKRSPYRVLGTGAAMLILILDAPAAVSACRDGISLCLQTLIPSLFPFFLISVLLTDALSGWDIPLLRPVEHLCRIPQGSGSLFLSGFFGGYPVGAQGIAMAYRRGQLTKQDAERMLAFSNNAGPAFLFGMIGSFFDHIGYVWLLWAIHIASALAVARLMPGAVSRYAPVKKAEPISPVQAMEKAIRAMASVCGWVVVFRTVLGYLNPLLSEQIPPACQIALNGVIELSNGCLQLGQIGDSGLRLMLASAMLAFGGLCVTMQTRSVCAGLSGKYYLPGKLLQTAISCALSLAVQPLLPQEEQVHPAFFWTISAILIVVILVTRAKRQENKGSIPGTIGV